MRLFQQHLMRRAAIGQIFYNPFYFTSQMEIACILFEYMLVCLLHILK